MNSHRKFVSTALLIAALVVLILGVGLPARSVSAGGYCDAAQFIADVTVPDGTNFSAGAAFTKTWRLKNVGLCTWTTGYSLAFASGEKMGGPDAVPFSQTVSPGQVVDLTVNLIAPSSAGSYRGYWMLKNASGALFGIGVTADKSFWVEINVLAPTIEAYDFVAEICSAQWYYDGGPIPCPAKDAKKDFGYAIRVENPVLENGSAAGQPGLLTVPQNKYNGAIHGAFPIPDIFPGDHFQAIIGCQYGAVDCYVTFELDYLTGEGEFTTVWKFREKYDGLVYPVDVDLSKISYKKNIRLVLTISAYGPASGDKPIWVAPRIVRPVAVAPVTPTPVVPVGPTATPVSGCSNAAQFVTDVTVPDGTSFLPGAAFTKTWRLKNVGSCTWTTAYSLVFAGGEKMSGPDSVPFSQSVAPGGTVDLSVNLTAPLVAGVYRGYWQLRNASGGLFGIGATADKPFWVEINVSGTSGGSAAYDFAANACSAAWFSGAGALPCPGTDGDVRGFVLPMANPKLENGVTDARPGLLAFPENVYNGYIQGFFPAFGVQSGDRFRATVSCEFNAVDCFVLFRLDYQIGSGPLQTFWTFGERYDGFYYSVDLDLSSLAGQDVKFILTVLSNGAASGDRALWVAPQIIRAGGAPTLTPYPSPTVPPPTETPTPFPSGTPTPLPTATPTPTP